MKRPNAHASDRTPPGPESHRPGVVVVDFHLMFGALICGFLDQFSNYRVCGPTVSSARAAIQLCRTTKPTLVMTELRLDEIRGPEMIGMIRDELPNIRFLIFTGSTSPACLVAASATQPDGFVHKTESLDTLSQALTTIAGGGRFQSPTITAHLKRANEKKPDHHLTDRENTIIALVAEGRSTKEIASVINRSLKTTEELRGKLLKRLDLPHPSDVVKFALRTGLCDE